MAKNNLELFKEHSSFVAFDTETTGLWAPSNRLVEIAGVKFQIGSDEIETFQSLINPEREIPREVVAVHGITDEMVAKADTAKKVLKKFIKFCGGSVLIAHNSPFDVSFVACELDRVGVERPKNIVLDTVEIFKKYYPGRQSYSLLSLSQEFGFAKEQEHRALDDAILVQKLFAKAVGEKSKDKPLEQFLKKLTKLSLNSWKLEEVALPDGYSEFERALAESLRVEISYLSIDSKNGGEKSTFTERTAKVRVIVPKTVYALRSKLYINAFCELSGEERTFRLDRIESYRLLG